MKIGVNKRFTALDDLRHKFFAGMTGTAKTNFVESLAGYEWSKKRKVIMFTLKDECCQLGFPETDKSLVKLIKTDFFSCPRPYPTEVLVPFSKSAFESKQTNKMHLVLPSHTKEFIDFQKEQRDLGRDYGWSEWKPFKLRFSDMKVPALMSLSGKPTELGQTLLGLVSETKDYETIEELFISLTRLSAKKDNPKGSALVIGSQEQDIESEIGKHESFLALLNLITSVQKTGLLCNSKSPFALDFDAMLRDTETITVFNLSSLETKFAFMVFVTVIGQILSLRLRSPVVIDKVSGKRKFTSKSFPPLVTCIPELSYFASRKKSYNPLSAESLSVIQYISMQGRILRWTLVGDAQAPQDVNPSVLRNFGWICATRCQEEVVKYIHENIVPLQPPVKYALSGLKVGVYAFIQIGSTEYFYPCFVRPSLAYHRKPQDSVLEWIGEQPFVVQREFDDVIPAGLKIQEVRRGENIGESIKEIIDKAVKENKLELKKLEVKQTKELKLKAEKRLETEKKKLRKEFEGILKKNKEKLVKDIFIEKVLGLYGKGKPQREIADFLGVTQQRVSQIIQTNK